MDSERATSSRIGERPVTRWRRDQEDTSNQPSKVIERTTSANRPQSKFERPRSRRGTSEEFLSDQYNAAATYRSATPGRNALARPPSASVFISNRAPTANSRFSTTLTTASGRLNTGLSTSGQIAMGVIERPITQQGIAGIRPGTTRGLPMTRQIQDKRYYLGLLQLKIRELSQEITTILKDIENQNKERATFLHYDKRAKDLAAELTVLQGELADYNIVVDKMTSDSDKESIEQEARELAFNNERNLMQIERMFEQRKELEQRLNKMEKQLENEKKRTERLVESMDPRAKEKYDALSKRKAELQEKASKMQRELDDLSKDQARLEEEIALSPLKQEAAKLYLKIAEAEEKKNKLKDEERNRLTPEEEKEKLLQKIKQDNMDIAAAEAQLSEKKKRIAETEQELEILEVDIENTQSEKQLKYKELRKREEVMEQFMSLFEQNKNDETKKLEKLEESIVKHLETISNTFGIDIDLSTSEEIAILQNMPPYDNYDAINHDQSFDGLAKEHLKLQQILNKMELLEQKLKIELTDLHEKISERKGRLTELEDLDEFKMKSEAKREELSAEYEQLKVQSIQCEQELRALQDDYNDIKRRLKDNEAYAQINILEEKLEKLKKERKEIEHFIDEQKGRSNYSEIKKHAFHLLNEYSLMLNENLKSLY